VLGIAQRHKLALPRATRSFRFDRLASIWSIKQKLAAIHTCLEELGATSALADPRSS